VTARRTAAVLALLAVSACGRVELSNDFHAVLLDNNSVYFGRVENFGDAYLVLHEVYYLQAQAGDDGKPTNVLVRRGREWHGPDRMIIDARHVVFLEPVTSGSRVAQLIAEGAKK
jgi:hypothetical protein